MRKNLCVLGLVLTTAIGFTTVTARADEQVNTQITNQSAGAVGNGNSIYQQSDQINVQQQKRNGRGDSGGGTLQDSLQQTDQAAGTVGDDNYIEQNSSQMNIQQNNRRQLRNRYYNK
jgi:hypothetical protein